MTTENCGVLRMTKIVAQKRKTEFPRRPDTRVYIIIIINQSTLGTLLDFL